MNLRLRINGQPGQGVAADDRGLCYGDGLFETLYLHDGCAPLWPRHMTRLAEGCRRLNLPTPDPERLWREVLAASAGLVAAVVKVTWTRGSGQRGYAAPEPVQPTLIVSAAAPTPWPEDWYHAGIRMHLCRTRLAIQPLLAGMKHLNRLEQVLARSEWQDQTVAEGLMLDLQERVVSATASNVFAVDGNTLRTPPVERCGVAGVARAELLARWPDTVVADLSLEDLFAADALFITSAVRGIVPVRELAGYDWVGPVRLRDLQRDWYAAGLPGAVRT
ncbi:MAG: aminodeoxychorismate lyase [Xanthomonadales bacterium]|nr:aminodeoxychorismate lyase [Xanthomonadales bacterium]